MRNHLALRAWQSQARVGEAHRLPSLLMRCLCVLSLAFVATAAEQAPTPKNGGKPPHSMATPQPYDIWLREALQRYEEWKKLRDANPAEARAVVERAMQQAQGVPQERQQRIARGFMAWRTLETVIDRERVDRALAEYYKRFSGKSARTADFLAICKEVSGRDLRWFLDYYINGSELPRITLRRTPGSAVNETTGQILVENAPREFQVRVEMRLFTAAGALDHSVATNGEVTPFTVTTAQPVTRIALDPDMRILRQIR